MADTDTPPAASLRLRLTREAGGYIGAARTWWDRQWLKRWFRRLTWLVAAFLIALFALWLFVARGLPDAETLVEYQPPLPSIVRDGSGMPTHRC
jgi:penicillin-binding protein 1A